MKRILFAIAIAFAFAFNASCETYNLMSTKLLIYSGSSWVQQTDGYGIPIQININASNATIIVHSNKFQLFNVVEISDRHMNTSNHYQFVMHAYDEDGQRCTIRFVERNDNDGPFQLYFIYNNIAYVYSCRMK